MLRIPGELENRIRFEPLLLYGRMRLPDNSLQRKNCEQAKEL